MTVTLILHLGPHKTATTLMQETMVRAESALAAEQVSYATTGRNDLAHHDLAFALWSPDRRTNLMSAGRTLPSWLDLAAEVDGAPDGTRVVVSSENFAHVRDDEIGGAGVLDSSVQVELVVGVRRLDALLPSLWQEGVKWGRQWSFEEAVDSLLDEDRVRLLPMLDRWSDAVHPRAVHALAMPADHGAEAMLRSFADVIGCAGGTLTDSAPSGAANASLSWLHTEALRSVSTTIDPDGLQSSLVRRQQILHQLIPLVPPTGATTVRPTVPVRLRSALEEVRQEIRRGLTDRGVIVHGALPEGSTVPSAASPTASPALADVDAALGWVQGNEAVLSPEALDAVAATRLRIGKGSVVPRRRWRHVFTKH